MKQGKERFTPLSRATKDLIIMYRTQHKLSYRAIEKRMDVSRETARLICLEEIPEERVKSENYKNKVRANKVKIRSITKRPKPKPQHSSVRDYDFLQYIRVVYKWALQENPELSRGQLEMLLYLYPKGAFTYGQFHKYHKLVGLYQRRALDYLIDKGYLKVWKVRSPKLYTLTEKAKTLCDTMHKYCTGDKKVPMGEDSALVVDKATRINNYYLDMIADMNKRKKIG